MSKNDCPVLGSKITNILGFSILSLNNCFRVRLHRVCIGRVGRMLVQFMWFSAIFVLLVFLAGLVTLSVCGTHSEGWNWG